MVSRSSRQINFCLTCYSRSAMAYLAWKRKCWQLFLCLCLCLLLLQLLARVHEALLTFHQQALIANSKPMHSTHQDVAETHDPILNHETYLKSNNLASTKQMPADSQKQSSSFQKSEMIDHTCRKIKKYNMTICYYANKDNDRFISNQFLKGGYYEESQVDLMLKWLDLDPELSLVDLGTNIGTYTLPVAASGRQVISVEPYPPNIQLLTRSLHLSGLSSQVTVVPCGVSGQREVLRLLLDDTNKGHVQLAHECGNKCSEFLVAGLLLDDLPAFRPSISKAIVKMDIEGSERQSLLASSSFFSALKVPILLMEWRWIPRKTPEQVTVTQEMLSGLQRGDYVPHHPLKGGELSLNRMQDGWPNNVVWVRRDFIARFKTAFTRN